MTDRNGAPGAASDRTRWRLSRWGWTLVGVVAFGVILRLALPTIALKIAVAQGEEYLDGQLEVGDVDLWLLSGGLALKDVALRADEAAPEEPPLVSWKRLYVNIGWFQLLGRIANVEDLELDGLRVNVARLHDGTLVLPELRERAEEEPEPESEDTEPFGVLIDRAALLNARIRVRDDVPGTPTYRELELPSIVVTGLSLNDEDGTAPGHLVVQAGLGAGTIRVDTRLAERDGGLHTEARIDVANLPLDQLHVHEPSLGWSRSTGRLSANVHLTVDREARIRMSGRVAIDDLGIEVPGEDDPALSWRRFAVEMDEVDVARQRADLRRVSLDGGSVLVRLRDPSPLPILPRPSETASQTTTETPPEVATLTPAAEPVSAGTAQPPDVAPDVVGPDTETGAAGGTASNGPNPEAEAGLERPAAPWSIHIATIEVTDTAAALTLDPASSIAHVGTLTGSTLDATKDGEWTIASVELVDASADTKLVTGPALVEIPKLTVTGLSSDPESTLHAVGTIKEDSAILDLDASVVREPLSAQAKLDLEDVRLGRYADLSGVSPVRFSGGVLQAALAVEYEPSLAHVSGQLAVNDLQIETPDGEEEFGAAWESLDLDIRSLEIPLMEREEETVRLELADVRVVAPNLRVTRTPEGIVLPTVKVSPVEEAHAAPSEETSEGTAQPDETSETNAPEKPASGEAQTEGSPEPAEAAAAETTDVAATRVAPPPTREGYVVQTESLDVDEIAEIVEPATKIPLDLALDRLRVERGKLRVEDRGVEPTYRGTIENFELDITGLQLPEAVFEKMTLDFTAPGGAPVSVKADRESQGIRIDANIEGLPLSQFNPYVQESAGYTVLDGAATLETRALWGAERYESDSDLVFRDLDVGNERGGTLFTDSFGIPIEAALALLRDITGKIGLGIPVSGSLAGGTEIGIGSVVAQAITKAILGAVTSPLKLLGAFTMIGDKIGEVTPSPVRFRPGTAEVSKEASEQVDRIGDVLAAQPDIRLGFSGRAGAEDVRALKEAAVLADLQDEGVFGGLRNLVSGGTRGAIRNALQARAEGEAGELDDDDAAELDEMVAEKSVSDEELTALASRRAERVRQILVEDDGVPEDQIAIGEPQISRTEGSSEVATSLLSSARTATSPGRAR